MMSLIVQLWNGISNVLGNLMSADLPWNPF